MSHFVNENEVYTPPSGKKALPPWEQSAAVLWVAEDSWNVFANALHAEGLLQVGLPFANREATWVFVRRAWGRAFGASCKAVATKGMLSRTTMASLKANSKDQAKAHLAWDWQIHLGSHLWVDHLYEYCALWGGVEQFLAFRGEQRHKPLKGEIPLRSFKGGVKKCGKERGVKHAFPEVFQSDNLDFGLWSVGLTPWVHAWSKQPKYLANRPYWDAVLSNRKSHLGRPARARLHKR